MQDGRRVEVGLVGSEGMLSTSSFMGGEGSPNEGMVQVADGGLRMKTEVLVEEFNRGGALQGSPPALCPIALYAGFTVRRM